jgi:hypothetical protein
MLHRKIIVFCSEVLAKHLNKVELHYRLSPYRAVNAPRQGFKFSHLMLYGKESRFIPRYIQNTQIKLNHITGSDRIAQKTQFSVLTSPDI